MALVLVLFCSLAVSLLAAGAGVNVGGGGRVGVALGSVGRGAICVAIGVGMSVAVCVVACAVACAAVGKITLLGLAVGGNGDGAMGNGVIVGRTLGIGDGVAKIGIVVALHGPISTLHVVSGVAGLLTREVMVGDGKGVGGSVGVGAAAQAYKLSDASATAMKPTFPSKFHLHPTSNNRH